jgi:hypothetical protein
LLSSYPRSGRPSCKHDSIESCYARLAEIIGPGIEHIDVIRRVEEHRCYWRPNRVRVVLLGESHVFTEALELRHQIRSHPTLPPDLPRGFVRFIYCLGCGEDVLLQEALERRNSGTPQFWKVFLSCTRQVTSGEDFAPVLKSRTTSIEKRLENKLRVLTELRDLGAWLVDASIAGLYTPGRRKPGRRVIEAVLHACWDTYVKSELETFGPEAILVIGHTVAQHLRTRLDALGVPWARVPAPNARLSAAEHFRIFDSYYRVCHDPGEIAWIRENFHGDGH